MQDRLAKERFVESIPDQQVGTKLRYLKRATPKDTLVEACMLEPTGKPRHMLPRFRRAASQSPLYEMTYLKQSKTWSESCSQPHNQHYQLSQPSQPRVTHQRCCRNL